MEKFLIIAIVLIVIAIFLFQWHSGTAGAEEYSSITDEKNKNTNGK